MSIASEPLEEKAVEPEPEPAPASREPEAPSAQPAGEELVVEDLLVEDVSIDGMCGVY